MLRVQASVRFPQAVVVEPSQPTPLYYRHLHDFELGVRGFSLAGTQYKQPWDWRAKNGDPEVFWVDGGTKTPFTGPWQWLAYGLNEGVVSRNKFTIVYDDHRAFMNRTGFWNSDSPFPYAERRDYVNKQFLNGEMPAWDKIRVCGGMTLRGTVSDDWFYPEYLPFDESLPNDGAPTVEWLRAHPWLMFDAVTCHVKADGSAGISPFNQGGGQPVKIPFVAKAGSVLRIPLGAVEQVGAIADPYKIYIS